MVAAALLSWSAQYTYVVGTLEGCVTSIGAEGLVEVTRPDGSSGWQFHPAEDYGLREGDGVRVYEFSNFHRTTERYEVIKIAKGCGA